MDQVAFWAGVAVGGVCGAAVGVVALGAAAFAAGRWMLRRAVGARS
ncbi:MAG: hypothetical protein KA105_02895 [Caulobacter sp.]|nr:hypothetical protein [Caulobacter sp.]